MATLNWKNITANTESGAKDFARAGSLFTKATDSFVNAVTDRQSRLKKRDESEILNKYAAISTEDEYYTQIGDINEAGYGEYADKNVVDAARNKILGRVQRSDQAENVRLQGLSDASLQREQAAINWQENRRTAGRTEDKFQATKLAEELAFAAPTLQEDQVANIPRNQQALALTEQEYPGAYILDAQGNWAAGPNWEPDAQEAIRRNGGQVGVQKPLNLSQRQDAIVNKYKEAAIAKGYTPTKADMDTIRSELQRSYTTETTLQGQLKTNFDTAAGYLRSQATVDIAAVDANLKIYLSSKVLDEEVSTIDKVAGITKLKEKFTAAGKSDDGSLRYGYVGGAEFAEFIDKIVIKYPNIRAEYIEQYLRSNEIGSDGLFDWDLAYDTSSITSQIDDFMKLNPNGSAATLRHMAIVEAAGRRKDIQYTSISNIAKLKDRHERDAGLTNPLKNKTTYFDSPFRLQSTTEDQVVQLQGQARGKTPDETPIVPPTVVEPVKAATNYAESRLLGTAADVEKAVDTNIDLALPINKLQDKIKQGWKDNPSTSPTTGKEKTAYYNRISALSRAFKKDTKDLSKAQKLLQSYTFINKSSPGYVSKGKINKVAADIKKLDAIIAKYKQ